MNMKHNYNYESLLALIPVGEQNAIKSKDLAMLMFNNCDDKTIRKLCNIIMEIRLDKKLNCDVNSIIMSTQNGFFISDNPKEDYPKFIRAQNNRTKKHQQIIAPIKKALSKIEEQERINNGETLF